MQPDLPHPFGIRTISDGRTTVVELRGELDIAAEPDIASQFTLALDARPETLTVDLRNLVFLDSTGLRTLLRLRESCAQSACNLVVVRGTPSVQRVFEVSGVAAHFTMVDASPQLQLAA